MNILKRSFSILLIAALCFTMVFMDYGVASAATDRGNVKSIKYLSPSSITIEENTEGQWSLDDNGEYYYRYRTGMLEPETFVAEYENGEEITYSYDGGKGDPYWSQAYYKGSDGERISVYSPLRSNQEEEHFAVGEKIILLSSLAELL